MFLNSEVDLKKQLAQAALWTEQLLCSHWQYQRRTVSPLNSRTWWHFLHISKFLIFGNDKVMKRWGTQPSIELSLNTGLIQNKTPQNAFHLSPLVWFYTVVKPLLCSYRERNAFLLIRAKFCLWKGLCVRRGWDLVYQLPVFSGARARGESYDCRITCIGWEMEE